MRFFPNLFSAVLVVSLAGHASAQTPDACSVGDAAPTQAVLHVTDATGAVLDHAIVEVRCGKQVQAGLTDRTGNVTLSVRSGTYHLTARAPGFAAYTQLVPLPAAEPVKISLLIGSANDVVNVTDDRSIVPFATTFGTKTDTSLMETPQTINVIDQREISLRDAQSVNEVLRYTPGVQTDEYGVELRQDWLLIRGFTADTFGVFRDGMRWDSLSGKVDPYELESVEVIKGPASVLYGQAPPGGLVNLTTKRPQAERGGTIEGQYGSYSRRQGQFDTTGSFDPNNVFEYRVLGLIRNTDTQVNYTPDNRRLIAPALAWHPSDRTSLNVVSDWNHYTTKWSQFLPAAGVLSSNPNGPIPTYAFAGEPGKEGVVRDEASVGYMADHAFLDGWQLHQNYRYNYSNFQGSTVYGTGFEPGSNTQLTRSYFSYPQYTYIHTLDSRALRVFNTTNWTHTVLAGFDFSDEAQRTTGSIGTVADINIYKPVYGAAITGVAAYLNNFEDTPQYGVYLQDQIKYKRHLAFNFGGREDWAVQDVQDYLYKANQHQNSSKFTGRAGVVYLTDIGLNPYYSFSTSFQPTPGTDFFGTLYKPTYGKQNEVGLKYQPRHLNGFVTASFFNIDQDNTLVADPNTAHPYSNVQTGAVRSRGVEVEAVTTLRAGLSLHGGFSRTAIVYTQSTTDAGKWIPQVPRNQFSMFADYGVRHGRFEGLGGNFGVRFTGLSYGDSDNTLAIPNFTLLDGAVRYTFRHAEFAVNATNLTDKTYVGTCTGIAYCGYGYKRNVLGNVKYHF